MGWESFDVVRFDLGPLLQGHMRIAKRKSAYNSIIIGMVGFDLEPLLQGHTKITKLKSAYNSLIFGQRYLGW